MGPTRFCFYGAKSCGDFIHYRRHDQANGAGVPPIGQSKSHCKRVAVGSVLLADLLYLHVTKNVRNGVKVIFCVLFGLAVLGCRC